MKIEQTFQYRKNWVNLCYGILMFVAAAIVVYREGIPFVTQTDLSVARSAAYLFVLTGLLGLALFYSKTFLTLFGEERTITIAENYLVLPKHGDSLETVRLDYSQIREVYFDTNRFGQQANLIIEYDVDDHAYIEREALDFGDFFDICESLKRKLRISEIEIR